MRYLKKYLINPQRIRKIPVSFSWIDRRFIWEGYLQGLSQEAILLYFFLVAVSDYRGLSFYGNRSIEKLLKMDNGQLSEACRELIEKDLIAYCAPVYQVLSVEKSL